MPILKRLLSILSVPLLIVGLMLGALMLFQDRLLYFPTKVTLEQYVPDGLYTWPQSTTPSESIAEPSPNVPLPDAHHELLGLISKPENNEGVTGLAVVFHGNAGHAGHRSYYADRLTPLGIRTILAEYPGYGPRSGSPSEKMLISDGVDVVTRAYQQYGGPVWLIGESLGAGVAAAVLEKVPSLVQGIVLITPWNRLMDVAAMHYPFLPVRWLLTSEYDSVEALHGFIGPKLVIVAENDKIVPAELGMDLFEKISQPKRLEIVKNAGHNDWISHVNPVFWQTSMNWLIDSAR